MLSNDHSRPIHYPADPNRFEFDSEVASIFQNMAQRSIPQYNEARRLTIAAILPRIWEAQENKRYFKILDIGASTGQFFRDLWTAMGIEYDKDIPYVQALAIDKSGAMVEKIRETLPKVATILGGTDSLRFNKEHYDVIVMAYVLQFIEMPLRDELLSVLCNMLVPGGLLLLSQKVTSPQPLEEYFKNEYYNFRLRNGYSMDEIEAKTQALKGSMWTETHDITRLRLEEAGFSSIFELCSWLQFRTCIVEK